MAKQIDSPKTAKRELAQRLYVDSNYTQEEVARIIGVTRQTVIRWAKEHHWQELKAATSVSPAEQIRQLRQQIANRQHQRCDPHPPALGAMGIPRRGGLAE